MRALAMGVGTACLLWAGSVVAHDTSPNACQVEDWRWWAAPGDMIVIEGAATCTDGTMQLRLYAGTGTERQFLGATTSYIEGHIFEALFADIEKPAELLIEYAITEGKAW